MHAPADAENTEDCHEQGNTAHTTSDCGRLLCVVGVDCIDESNHHTHCHGHHREEQHHPERGLHANFASLLAEAREREDHDRADEP